MFFKLPYKDNLKQKTTEKNHFSLYALHKSDILLSQKRPFPLYPETQLHVYDDMVLTQSACSSQGLVESLAHSSISELQNDLQTVSFFKEKKNHLMPQN